MRSLAGRQARIVTASYSAPAPAPLLANRQRSSCGRVARPRRRAPAARSGPAHLAVPLPQQGGVQPAAARPRLVGAHQRPQHVREHLAQRVVHLALLHRRGVVQRVRAPQEFSRRRELCVAAKRQRHAAQAGAQAQQLRARRGRVGGGERRGGAGGRVLLGRDALLQQRQELRGGGRAGAGPRQRACTPARIDLPSQLGRGGPLPAQRAGPAWLALAGSNGRHAARCAPPTCVVMSPRRMALMAAISRPLAAATCCRSGASSGAGTNSSQPSSRRNASLHTVGRGPMGSKARRETAGGRAAAGGPAPRSSTGAGLPAACCRRPLPSPPGGGVTAEPAALTAARTHRSLQSCGHRAARAPRPPAPRARRPGKALRLPPARARRRGAGQPASAATERPARLRRCPPAPAQASHCGAGGWRAAARRKSRARCAWRPHPLADALQRERAAAAVRPLDLLIDALPPCQQRLHHCTRLVRHQQPCALVGGRAHGRPRLRRISHGVWAGARDRTDQECRPAAQPGAAAHCAHVPVAEPALVCRVAHLQRSLVACVRCQARAKVVLLAGRRRCGAG